MSHPIVTTTRLIELQERQTALPYNGMLSATHAPGPSVFVFVLNPERRRSFPLPQF